MRVVTIDGPAGAGKSTVARMVAEELGWRFLDTGSMYRAVALAALERGVQLDDKSAVGRLAADLSVELPPGQVILDGRDVSGMIRRPEVTASTRHAADNPRVRSILVGWQRAFASRHDTVSEGRDQGTIVFPNAIRKYFLTATPEERARRRHAEMAARGSTRSYEEILEDQRHRDAQDEARAIAPLRPAEDAVQIDTTGLRLDAIVARVLADVRDVLNPRE